MRSLGETPLAPATPRRNPGETLATPLARGQRPAPSASPLVSMNYRGLRGVPSMGEDRPAGVTQAEEI